MGLLLLEIGRFEVGFLSVTVGNSVIANLGFVVAKSPTGANCAFISSFGIKSEEGIGL